MGKKLKICRELYCYVWFQNDLRQGALSNDIVGAKTIEITTHNKLPVVFCEAEMFVSLNQICTEIFVITAKGWVVDNTNKSTETHNIDF